MVNTSLIAHELLCLHLKSFLTTPSAAPPLKPQAEQPAPKTR
jgi:hypothetical protein